MGSTALGPLFSVLYLTLYSRLMSPSGQTEARQKKKRFLASHLSEAVVSQVCNKLKAGRTVDACRRTGMKRLLIILLNQNEDVIPCWGKKKITL